MDDPTTDLGKNEYDGVGACAHRSPDEIRSESLLRGAREVLIRHGGELYRLCHTRNDKLILTK